MAGSGNFTFDHVYEDSTAKLSAVNPLLKIPAAAPQPEKAARRLRLKASDIVTREYTIHMSPRMCGVTFKNRAPKAIREIKDFAKTQMKTSDVRVDVDLNKFVWAQGVKNVAKRIRVRLARRRNEDEDAKEKLYTLVSHVKDCAKGAKGMETKIVEA